MIMPWPNRPRFAEETRRKLWREKLVYYVNDAWITTDDGRPLLDRSAGRRPFICEAKCLCHFETISLWYLLSTIPKSFSSRNSQCCSPAHPTIPHLNSVSYLCRAKRRLVQLHVGERGRGWHKEERLNRKNKDTLQQSGPSVNHSKARLAVSKEK